MKNQLLGGAIHEMSRAGHVKPAHAVILGAAKDARNFVAHEAARLGHLSTIRATSIDKATTRLREEVCRLAKGDNLVSKWLYEIEEKDTAPARIRAGYEGWIDAWVFQSSKRSAQRRPRPASS